MEIRVGCELVYAFAQPTPMIMMAHVHSSRMADLLRPDPLLVEPQVPVFHYSDDFANRCARLVAPAGEVRLSTDTVVRDSGAWDPTAPDAFQHPVEELPPEHLLYLLGSRYCETDKLSEIAWRLFGGTTPGWSRVEAICDFVHNHITFGYGQARATRTAFEAFEERKGVCRDFAHLAIAFCRCMNIPARYCTGYVSDIGLDPPPADPMDFAAWIEVYLGGRWHMFDPRNHAPRRGRILIAQGRDATDVPITHTFGPNQLLSFKVWTDEAVPAAA